mgnify:FL=1
MFFRKISILIFFIFFTNLSYSFENYFLMLKNSKVNVRYGPSFDYPIKFIYKKKFLPVKIIDRKENFRKIIDHKMNNGWIHISQLKKVKSLITLQEQFMFQKPSKFSKPVAKLEPGRLLLIKKCEKSWCKVYSEDTLGWIEINDIWGKI